MTWLLGLVGMIPRSIIFGAVGLVAGAALLAGVYAYGKSAGRQQGREAALRQSVIILKQKAKTDEEIRDMSDAQLCRSLGGELHDGACR